MGTDEKNGKPQAINVTGGTGGSAKGGGKGTGACKGTVKTYNAMKGFGFIVGDDGQDVYLHVSACVDGWEPNTGDYLSYDVTPSKKQPQEGKTTSAME